MSGRREDRALDALLAGYAPPAPPPDLAERVAAAALAAGPAAPPLPPATAKRRDRRGAWLRRPVVAAAAALGLAFTGAVAASLAGVKVADLPVVEQVLTAVPFLAPEPEAEPAPPPVRAAAPAAAPVEAVPAEVAPAAGSPELRRARQARAVQRLKAARAIVDARRAAGLPTPRADRIEAAIAQRRIWRRRAIAGLPAASPQEQAWRQRAEVRRQIWLERQRTRRTLMSPTGSGDEPAPALPAEGDPTAGLPPPNGPAAPREAADATEPQMIVAAWREQRRARLQAWLAARRGEPPQPLHHSPAANDAQVRIAPGNPQPCRGHGDLRIPPRTGEE